MLVVHTQIGSNSFPDLQWKFTATTSDSERQKVKSWVIVVEDADAPLPNPIAHGVYFGIPVEKMGVGPVDLVVKDGEGNVEWALEGGFCYGINRRTVYSGLRPVMGHGVHRYFYQVIGVGEGFDAEKAI